MPPYPSRASHPTRRQALLAVSALATLAPTLVRADSPTLRFGVGLYQPDKEKNDATYRPLAEHLARQLGRPSSSTPWTPGKAWPRAWPPARPTSR